MTKPTMKISTPKTTVSQDQSLHAVYFEYRNPAARSVAVAGTFNDWRPQVTPMVNMGDARWRKVLMVVPGTYEYTFVVDGQWIEAPGTTRPAARELRPSSTESGVDAKTRLL